MVILTIMFDEEKIKKRYKVIKEKILNFTYNCLLINVINY